MGYIKKTTRTNKTGQTLTFTNDIFTIDELQQLNPDYCNITLRVHLKEAISRGDVIEIGYIRGVKGRPKGVMCVTPVTQEHLKQAEKREVILKNDLIINVSSTDNKVEVKTEEKKQPVITKEDIKQRIEKILA